MNLGLANNIVVVTGGASGIGRAIAELFAAEGASVAIWDVSDTVVATASEIAAASGQRVIGLRADITSTESLESAQPKSAAWGAWAVAISG